ncbi:MAG TPA: phosphoribosyltransferase [Archaeoglobus profundus]|nr:phosphoribosyltransferase [Archaeoglobus profundus]
MKCIVTNWDYMDNLCRRVAKQIMDDKFEPDLIIALAKGGWFAGKVLCDILGLEDLISLRIEHYKGIQEKDVIIKQTIPKESVNGKNVLIVDDIANTGMSIRKAKEYIESLNVNEARTATLLLLGSSKFIPDYFGECIEEQVWVIFPWNFVEDMISLIVKLMKEEKRDLWTKWDIKWSLYKKYNINPIHLDIAQPGRFEEVLSIMERRGIIVKIVEEDREYLALSQHNEYFING